MKAKEEFAGVMARACPEPVEGLDRAFKGEL